MGKDILPRFSQKGRKVDISAENVKQHQYHVSRMIKKPLIGIVMMTRDETVAMWTIYKFSQYY